MNKLICWLFRHKYKFNFASMPDKCICKNCKRKWYWNGKIGEGYYNMPIKYQTIYTYKLTNKFDGSIKYKIKTFET